MSKNEHHVVPTPDGEWGIKKSGGEKYSHVYDTKKDAVDKAREISRNQGTELVIHRKNGTIEGKDSHGNDNFTPKG